MCYFFILMIFDGWNLLAGSKNVAFKNWIAGTIFFCFLIICFEVVLVMNQGILASFRSNKTSKNVEYAGILYCKIWSILLIAMSEVLFKSYKSLDSRVIKYSRYSRRYLATRLKSPGRGRPEIEHIEIGNKKRFIWRRYKCFPTAFQTYEHKANIQC